MNDKPKLVVGRIQNLEGRQVLTPLSHAEETLRHQEKLAALISSAYLYRDTHTVESIERLKRAAEEL